MELECKYSDFDRENAPIHTATVISASITEPGIEIKAIKSDQSPTKEVQGLTFQVNCVYYVPHGISKHFPHLTDLMIYKCGLKAITRKDLEGLDQLIELDCSENELKCLPNDLFVGMKNLRRIDFSNNKIEFLSSKLLEPIKHILEFIDFENNTKIDECFEKNVYNSLEALMEAIDEKCSPPVEAMFSVDGQMNNVENFNEESFGDFISFFYSDVVKSEENVNELNKLAAELSVPQLQEICEQILLEDLNESNALEISISR